MHNLKISSKIHVEKENKIICKKIHYRKIEYINVKNSTFETEKYNSFNLNADISLMSTLKEKVSEKNKYL